MSAFVEPKPWAAFDYVFEQRRETQDPLFYHVWDGYNALDESDDWEAPEGDGIPVMYDVGTLDSRGVLDPDDGGLYYGYQAVHEFCVDVLGVDPVELADGWRLLGDDEANRILDC